MEPNETELRELAKQHVQARIGLVNHVAMYAVVNAGLVIIWAVTGARYPWFLWPLFGWGVGIVAHVISYYSGPGSAREERAIERELHRLHTRTHG